MHRKVETVFVRVFLGVLASCAAVITYWWAVNTFMPSTTFRDPHVVGPSILKPGDDITVAYVVTRYRDCKLLIGRYVRRKQDHREVLMQSVTQIISADRPPVARPSQYIAEIPKGLIGPGEQSVEADVFSRVQYFCNGLDWLIPRIVDMDAVPVTIVP